MSIEQTIATDWSAVVSFIKKEWAGFEAWADQEVHDFLTAFAPAAAKLAAGQYTILSNLAKTALAELGSGDIAGCVQAILEQAQVQELGWVVTLGEDFLSAIVVVTAQNAANAANDNAAAGGSQSAAS
jgi:hypothetical protein